MRTENLRCDFCKKLTTDEGKKMESLHGFCITMGFSRGGWGSRDDWTTPNSYEICSACFTAVEQKSKEMEQVLVSLGKRPQVTFRI